jgi:hypothetical protein
VDNLFKDYVHVVSTTEEAMTLFTRIAKEGPNVQDLERARSGAEYVLREHTWERRLAEIVDLVGVGCAR